ACWRKMEDNLVERFGHASEKLRSWLGGLVEMLPNIAVALVVVLIAAFGARWVQSGVTHALERITNNRPVSSLLGLIAKVAVILFGLFIALGMLDLDKTVTSLLAGVGVIGLALGFAFQDIAANFMSGIMIAIRRPFDTNDLVEVAGHKARVRRIALRATELETLDGLTVLVPNKDVFQNSIINYTRTPTRRLDLPVGTAYADDMEKVREVTLGALEDLGGRKRSRPVEVFFDAFGNSSIDFTVRIWLRESDERSYLFWRSEALIAIKKAYNRTGITIPFPIRTLDFGARVVGGERLDQMDLGRAPTRPAYRAQVEQSDG
ncbi:MAG: mechanosensitive ion channel family protein, partial [Myxococcota bacterium]